MPPLLNAAAVISCPHGTGMVLATPGQARVLVGGAPALTVGDCASWVIAPGCTQLPTPATPGFVPCLKVLAPLGGGVSTRVMIGGVPALLATAQFSTNGLPVPAPATVKAPGQVRVMAAG